MNWKTSLGLAVLTFAVGAVVSMNSGTSSVIANILEEKKPVYRHFVMFKFEETAKPEQIQGVVDAFKALPGKIDTIKGFEMGTNVSPEGHDKGYTHAFLVTFDDKAGLEKYLPHPAHKEFGGTLKGVMKDVLVFDYVAK